MKVEHKREKVPFFSICIPQYNRFPFLRELCLSIAAQTYDSFEICISDDVSPEAGEAEIIALLRERNLPFVYERLEKNVRYDANLRNAIGLAKGRYCLLMGNDDALAHPGVLAHLHTLLSAHDAAALFSNYENYASGEVFKRVVSPGLVKGTPGAGAKFYRDFSFVSGVVLDRELSQKHVTTKWDGSEMYQMYLAGKIIASGRGLYLDDHVTVRKDIAIPHLTVDSYAKKLDAKKRWDAKKDLPLAQLPAVVCDSLGNDPKINYAVCRQFYSYTIPFWLFEFRRAASWRYSFGFGRSVRPSRILGGVSLNAVQKASLRILHGIMMAACLTIPRVIFFRFLKFFHYLAKKLR